MKVPISLRIQTISSYRPQRRKRSLRKLAYSNILKILPKKKINFSDKKNSDIFHISAQNIDCGYLLEPPQRGGSNEYPQSMFLSRNKKNNVYPCKPKFYYVKVGFKGVILYRYVFVMHLLTCASNEDSNKLSHPCSVIILRCLLENTLHTWPAKMRSV